MESSSCVAFTEQYLYKSIISSVRHESSLDTGKFVKFDLAVATIGDQTENHLRYTLGVGAIIYAGD